MRSFVDKQRQSRKKIRVEQKDFKAQQKYEQELEKEKTAKRHLKVQVGTDA